MKKITLILGVLILLTSCSKRKIVVPKVAMQGEEMVTNHSEIWMFYKDGKVDVNEKNRISSTNWFYNIDKKLTLKEIFPEINRLFIKHLKKSPHNTKPMKNYFTYINSLNNHLSFYQFDSITYKLINKNKLPKFKGDTILLSVNSTTIQIPIIKDNTIVQVVFDAKMNFQDYMEAKKLFNKVIPIEHFSTKEYIIINN